MINNDSTTLLKNENISLEEDLVHYKGINVDLRAKIRDLEDENRSLKEKLIRLTATKNRTIKKYRLGSHFPQKLLKTIKNNRISTNNQV